MISFSVSLVLAYVGTTDFTDFELMTPTNIERLKAMGDLMNRTIAVKPEPVVDPSVALPPPPPPPLPAPPMCEDNESVAFDMSAPSTPATDGEGERITCAVSCRCCCCDLQVAVAVALYVR